MMICEYKGGRNSNLNNKVTRGLETLYKYKTNGVA